MTSPIQNLVTVSESGLFRYLGCFYLFMPRFAVFVILYVYGPHVDASHFPQDVVGPVNQVIRTDHTQYMAEHQKGSGNQRTYAFTIVARLENHSKVPFYLERCYSKSTTPIYAVELVGGREGEESGYDGIWACMGGNRPIVVRPGRTRIDRFRIFGPRGRESDTGIPLGVLEGQFRLVYSARPCRAEMKCKLKEISLHSNVFIVRIER